MFCHFANFTKIFCHFAVLLTLPGLYFKGIWLSKALTCLIFFLYKQKRLFYQEDRYFGYIDKRTILTSHTDHFTPQNTAFQQSAACLSVVFELLPGFGTLH